jgi:hypothetical protein
VATGEIEYGTPAWFAHTDVDPVIDAGVAGVPFTERIRTALLPQALFAVTLTVPVVNEGKEILADVPLGVTTAPATLVDQV